jgi:hypothetical protein
MVSGLCMHVISSERGNNTLSVNLLLSIFMCVKGECICLCTMLPGGVVFDDFGLCLPVKI